MALVARLRPIAAAAALAACAALVLSAVAVLAAADNAPATGPAQEPAFAVWHTGTTYTYRLHAHYYQGTGPGTTANPDEVERWSPPYAPEDRGVRCDVALTPIQLRGSAYESAEAAAAALEADALVDLGVEEPRTKPWRRRAFAVQSPQAASADADAAAADGVATFRAQVTNCVTSMSRFGSEHVAQSGHGALNEDADADFGHALSQVGPLRVLETPFFFDMHQDGSIRATMFFPNETLATRNFKRGAIASLSLTAPAPPPPSTPESSVHGESSRRRLMGMPVDGAQGASSGTDAARAHRFAAPLHDDEDWHDGDHRRHFFGDDASDAEEAATSGVVPQYRYAAVDRDEHGLYEAQYTLTRRAGDGALQVRRDVSHERIFESSQDGLDAQDQRNRLPKLSKKQHHAKSTVLTVRDHDRLLLRTHTRAVHGIESLDTDTSFASNGGSGPEPSAFDFMDGAKGARSSAGEEDYHFSTGGTKERAHEEKSANLMDDPPLQYVEAFSELYSVRRAPSHLQHHRVQVDHEPAPTAEQARREASTGAAPREFHTRRLLHVHPPTAAADVVDDVDADADGHADEVATGARRTQQHQPALVLEVSGLTAFFPSFHGDEDGSGADPAEAEGQHTRALFEGDLDPEGTVIEFEELLDCAERYGAGSDSESVSGDGGAGVPSASTNSATGGYERPENDEASNQRAVACIGDYARRAIAKPYLQNPVIEALEPETMADIQSTHGRGMSAVLAIASIVGSKPLQEGLAHLLMAIDYRVPELKSYADAHEFFLILHAIEEVKRPLGVLFDALLASLEHHKGFDDDRGDMIGQLMLTLGVVARRVPEGHPRAEQARAVLNAAFDEAWAANADVEAAYNVHLRRAHEMYDAFGEHERLMWVSHFNTLDKRETHEALNNAHPEERARWTNRTIDAIARHLADATDGSDDGYGMRADDRGDHVSTLHALMKVQAHELKTAAWALSNLGHADDVHRVLQLATHRKATIRSTGLEALSHFPSPEARRVLLSTINDETERSDIRVTAVDALAEWPDEHFALDTESGNHIADELLAHLGAHHQRGTDWDLCHLDCADNCKARPAIRCVRECIRRCEGHRRLERHVGWLTFVQWKGFYDEIGAEYDAAAPVRVVNADGTESYDYVYEEQSWDEASRTGAYDAWNRAGRKLPEESLLHGHDKHPLRHPGARRLFDIMAELSKLKQLIDSINSEINNNDAFKVLPLLEDKLSYTKFYFKAGISWGWKLEAGTPALVGAKAAIGIHNAVELSAGLFGGFFEININNFGLLRVSIFGFNLDFFHVKLALIGGASFAPLAGGSALGNALATIGNVANTVRQGPGRVAGKIMFYYYRIQEVKVEAQKYLDKVTGFLELALQFKDVGALVKHFVKQAIDLVFDKVKELIDEYNVISIAKNLALSAYDRAIAFVTGPQSPLTKALEFKTKIEDFINKVFDFVFEIDSTVNNVFGRVMTFTQDIRDGIAKASRIVDKIARALENWDRTKDELFDLAAEHVNMIVDMLDVPGQVDRFLVDHVDQYLDMIPPVTGTITRVQTTINVVAQAVSGDGVDINFMKKTLLGYMKALVPSNSEQALKDGDSASTSMQNSLLTKVSRVLQQVDVSKALELAEQAASGGFTAVEDAIAQIQADGLDSVSALTGSGGESPIEAAIDGVVAKVEAELNGIVSSVQEAIAGLASGLSEPGSPTGDSTNKVAKSLEPVMAALEGDVLPRALETITTMLSEMQAEGGASSLGEIIDQFQELLAKFKEAQGFLVALASASDVGNANAPAPEEVDTTGLDASEAAAALAEAAAKGNEYVRNALQVVAVLRQGMSFMTSGVNDLIADIADGNILALLDNPLVGAGLDLVVSKLTAVLEPAVAEITASQAETESHVTSSGGTVEDASAAAAGLAPKARAAFDLVVSNLDLVKEFADRPQTVLDQLSIMDVLGTALASQATNSPLLVTISQINAVFRAMVNEDIEGTLFATFGDDGPAALVEVTALRDALQLLRDSVLVADVESAGSWTDRMADVGVRDAVLAALDTVVDKYATVFTGATARIAGEYVPGGGAEDILASIPVDEMRVLMANIRTGVAMSHAFASALLELQEGVVPVLTAGEEPPAEPFNMFATVGQIATDTLMPLMRDAREVAAQAVRDALINAAASLQATVVDATDACVASVRVTAGTASETYATAKRVKAALAGVVDRALAGQVTPEEGFEFAATAAKAFEHLDVDCRSLTAALHDTVVWRETASIVNIVMRLYKPAAYLAASGQVQAVWSTATDIADGSVSPADGFLQLVDQSKAVVGDLVTVALSDFVSGWFARYSQQFTDIGNDLVNRFSVAEDFVDGFSDEEYTAFPVHPTQRAVLTAVKNAGASLAAVFEQTASRTQAVVAEAMSLPLGDAQTIKAFPDFEDIGVDAVTGLVEALTTAADEVLAALADAAAPTFEQETEDAAGDIVVEIVREQYCVIITVIQPVEVEECFEVPKVGASPTQVNCSVTLPVDDDYDSDFDNITMMSNITMPCNHTTHNATDEGAPCVCEDGPTPLEQQCLTSLVDQEVDVESCVGYRSVGEVMAQLGPVYVSAYESALSVEALAQELRGKVSAFESLAKLKPVQQVLRAVDSMDEVIGAVEAVVAAASDVAGGGFEDLAAKAVELLRGPVKDSSAGSGAGVRGSLSKALSEKGVDFLWEARDRVATMLTDGTVVVDALGPIIADTQSQIDGAPGAALAALEEALEFQQSLETAVGWVVGNTTEAMDVFGDLVTLVVSVVNAGSTGAGSLADSLILNSASVTSQHFFFDVASLVTDPTNAELFKRLRKAMAGVAGAIDSVGYTDVDELVDTGLDAAAAGALDASLKFTSQATDAIAAIGALEFVADAVEIVDSALEFVDPVVALWDVLSPVFDPADGEFSPLDNAVSFDDRINWLRGELLPAVEDVMSVSAFADFLNAQANVNPQEVVGFARVALVLVELVRDTSGVADAFAAGGVAGALQELLGVYASAVDNFNEEALWQLDHVSDALLANLETALDDGITALSDAVQDERRVAVTLALGEDESPIVLSAAHAVCAATAALDAVRELGLQRAAFVADPDSFSVADLDAYEAAAAAAVITLSEVVGALGATDRLHSLIADPAAPISAAFSDELVAAGDIAALATPDDVAGAASAMATAVADALVDLPFAIGGSGFFETVVASLHNGQQGIALSLPLVNRGFALIDGSQDPDFSLLTGLLDDVKLLERLWFDMPPSYGLYALGHAAAEAELLLAAEATPDVGAMDALQALGAAVRSFESAVSVHDCLAEFDLPSNLAADLASTLAAASDDAVLGAVAATGDAGAAAASALRIAAGKTDVALVLRSLGVLVSKVAFGTNLVDLALDMKDDIVGLLPPGLDVSSFPDAAQLSDVSQVIVDTIGQASARVIEIAAERGAVPQRLAAAAIDRVAGSTVPPPTLGDLVGVVSAAVLDALAMPSADGASCPDGATPSTVQAYVAGALQDVVVCGDDPCLGSLVAGRVTLDAAFGGANVQVTFQCGVGAGSATPVDTTDPADAGVDADAVGATCPINCARALFRQMRGLSGLNDSPGGAAAAASGSSRRRLLEDVSSRYPYGSRPRRSPRARHDARLAEAPGRHAPSRRQLFDLPTIPGVDLTQASFAVSEKDLGLDLGGADISIGALLDGAFSEVLAQLQALFLTALGGAGGRRRQLNLADIVDDLSAIGLKALEVLDDVGSGVLPTLDMVHLDAASIDFSSFDAVAFLRSVPALGESLEGVTDATGGLAGDLSDLSYADVESLDLTGVDFKGLFGLRAFLEDYGCRKAFGFSVFDAIHTSAVEAIADEVLANALAGDDEVADAVIARFPELGGVRIGVIASTYLVRRMLSQQTTTFPFPIPGIAAGVSPLSGHGIVDNAGNDCDCGALIEVPAIEIPCPTTELLHWLDTSLAQLPALSKLPKLVKNAGVIGLRFMDLGASLADAYDAVASPDPDIFVAIDEVALALGSVGTATRGLFDAVASVEDPVATSAGYASTLAQDFEAIGIKLGGMGTLPELAAQLSQEMAPMSTFGVPMPDVGSPRLDVMTRLVADITAGIPNVPLHVTGSSRLPKIATLTFDEHLNNLSYMKRMFLLARIASYATFATRIGDVVAPIAGLIQSTVDATAAIGAPDGSTIDDWMLYVTVGLGPPEYADTPALITSVFATADDIVVTMLNGGFAHRSAGNVLSWVKWEATRLVTAYDAAISNVDSRPKPPAGVKSPITVQDREGLLECRRVANDEVVAALEAAEADAVARDNARALRALLDAIAAASGEAPADPDPDVEELPSAESLEVWKVLFFRLSALQDCYAGHRAGLLALLGEDGDALTARMDSVATAAEGALGYSAQVMQFVEGIDRLRAPLELAQLVVSLASATWDPIPSNAADIVAIARPAGAFIASRLGDITAALDGVAASDGSSEVGARVDVVRSRLQLGVSVDTPILTLLRTAADVEAIISAAKAQQGSDPNAAEWAGNLGELRMLTFQAAVGSLLNTATFVERALELIPPVVTALGSVVTTAATGDFDAAAGVAESELVPAVSDASVLVSEDMITTLIAKGGSLMSDVTIALEEILERLDAANLLDQVAGQAAAGFSYPAAAAATQLVAVLEEIKALAPTLTILNGLPLFGSVEDFVAGVAAGDIEGSLGSLDAFVDGFGTVDLNALGVALLDEVAHAGSLLAVARNALEQLRQHSSLFDEFGEGDAGGGEVVVDGAPVQVGSPAFGDLNRALSSLSLSPMLGAIQPLLWAFEGLNKFFAAISDLATGVADLVSGIMDVGILNVDSSTIEQAVDSIVALLTQTRATLGEGLVPPRVLFATLRGELGRAYAAAVDALAAATPGYTPEDEAAATATLAALDEVLAAFATGSKDIAFASPAQLAGIAAALSGVVSDASSSGQAVLAAVGGVAQAAVGQLTVISYLDRVIAALESAKDSTALELAKGVFDALQLIKDLANGDAPGDPQGLLKALATNPAVVALVKALEKQAQPVLDKLFENESLEGLALITAAQDAYDEVVAGAAAIDAAYGTTKPWLLRANARLADTVTFISGVVDDFMSGAAFDALEEDPVKAGADLFAKALELIVAFKGIRAESEGLSAELVADGVVGGTEVADPAGTGATVTVAYPMIADLIAQGSSFLSVRCVVGCDIDLLLAKGVRALSAVSTVVNTLASLLDEGDIDALLGAGREALFGAIDALASSAVDQLATPLHYASLEPTSDDAVGLLESLCGDMSAAAAADEYTVPAGNEAAAATAVADLEQAASELGSYISLFDLYNTFSGIRELSRRVDKVVTAAQAVKDTGLEFAQATILANVERMVGYVGDWAYERLTSTGVGAIQSSVSALDLVVTQVSTLTSLDELDATVFATVGASLADSLEGDLLTALADLTFNELATLSHSAAVDAIVGFQAEVEGTAPGADADVDAARTKAYQLASAALTTLEGVDQATAPLPMGSTADFTDVSINEYNTVLLRLSAMRAAVSAYIKAAAKQIVLAARASGTTISGRDAAQQALDSAPAAEALLAVLGDISDERFDAAARLVAGGSVELVSLMNAIGEVALLIESGADFTTILRQASTAINLLKKKLAQAVFMQASKVVGAVTRYVDRTQADIAAKDTAGGESSAGGLVSFGKKTIDFFKVVMTKGQKTLEVVEVMADRVKDFRNSIVGDVKAKLQLIDDAMVTVNDFFGQIDAFFVLAKQYIGDVETMRNEANKVVSFVMDKVNEKLQILLTVFDTVESVINDIEKRVLAIIRGTEAQAENAVAEVNAFIRRALNLDWLDAKIAELEAFVAQVQEKIDFWENIVVLALDITDTLRAANVDLGPLGHVLSNILSGIHFVNEKVAEFRALGDKVIGMYRKFTNVRTWVQPLLDAVPAEKLARELFGRVRSMLERVKTEAINMKNNLIRRAVSFIEQGIEYVLSIYKEQAPPVLGALELMRSKVRTLQTEVNAMFELVDRRELLFEKMEEALGYLDVPLNAYDAVRAFVDTFLKTASELSGGALAFGRRLGAALPDPLSAGQFEAHSMYNSSHTYRYSGRHHRANEGRAYAPDPDAPVGSTFRVLDAEDGTPAWLAHLPAHDPRRLNPHLRSLAAAHELYSDPSGPAASRLASRRARNLASLEECLADLPVDAATSVIDKVKAAAEFFVKVVTDMPTLIEIAGELQSVVDTTAVQSCVEGGVCGLQVLGKRLKDVADALGLFKSGLTGLLQLRAELPQFAAGLVSVLKCVNPVPDALDAVLNIVDDVLGAVGGSSIQDLIDEALKMTRTTKSVVVTVDKTLADVQGFFKEIKSVWDTLIGHTKAVKGVWDSVSKWTNEVVGALTDFDALRAKFEEYIDMLDLGRILKDLLEELRTEAHTFTDSVTIRSPFGLQEPINKAKLIASHVQTGINFVTGVQDTMLSTVTLLNTLAGMGKISTDLEPWNAVKSDRGVAELCTDESIKEPNNFGVCVRQEERAGVLYRNLYYPALYMQFWYETIPPVNDRNRMNRATIPGLFESYIPGGVAVLDANSYLLTLWPVGDRLGEPSLILRMRKQKDGKVMRIFQLYEEGFAAPFTGAVRDVEVSPQYSCSGSLHCMPKYVWTCDDSQDAERWPDKIDNRGNELYAIDYNSFDFNTRNGPPKAVAITRRYSIGLKPSSLYFQVSENGDDPGLWVSEYEEPAQLDPSGATAQEQGPDEFGVGNAASKEPAGQGRKKRKPAKSGRKRPRKNPPSRSASSPSRRKRPARRTRRGAAACCGASCSAPAWSSAAWRPRLRRRATRRCRRTTTRTTSPRRRSRWTRHTAMLRHRAVAGRRCTRSAPTACCATAAATPRRTAAASCTRRASSWARACAASRRCSSWGASTWPS